MDLGAVSGHLPFNASGLRDAAWCALYPRHSYHTTIRGHRCHYLDVGTGPPVVMVHGNPTWSFYYRRLALKLSARFRAIVPDHIGCGLSARPGAGDYGFALQDRVADFTDFMDQVAPDRSVDLVMHDWGGMIAMAWAVGHPEQVRRLVVLNTAAFLPPAGKPLPWQLALLRNLPRLAAPLVLRFNLFAGGAALLAPKKRLSNAARCGYLSPYNTPRNRLATLKFVQDIPISAKDPGYALVAGVEAQLPRLRQKPMLICWGRHDFVFDLDYLHKWRRLFPSARVHLEQGAGHYVLEDGAPGLLERIDTFLQRSGA